MENRFLKFFFYLIYIHLDRYLIDNWFERTLAAIKNKSCPDLNRLNNAVRENTVEKYDYVFRVVFVNRLTRTK